MSLYVTHRKRKRHRFWRTIQGLLILATITASTWIAWDIGQYSIETERQAIQRRNAELELQINAETQRGTKLLAELETLKRNYDTLSQQRKQQSGNQITQQSELQNPENPEADLITLIQHQIRQGVSHQQIANALAQLQASQKASNTQCPNGKTLAQQITIRTQLSRGGREAATFANGAISITLTAQDENGILPAQFNPNLPLLLTATHANNEPIVRQAKLPISFNIERQPFEYRFLATLQPQPDPQNQQDQPDQLNQPPSQQARANIRAHRCPLNP
ncbi:MAG: hypothetical protein OD811_00705 [Alphaproteobacteria bacterium]